MATMEMWEIAARLSIQQTMARYVRFADSGRSDELAALFTEQCVYEVLDGRICRTRAEVAAFVEEIKRLFASADNLNGRLRHHVSSIHIELLNENEARAGACYMAVGQSGPDHWGTYRDRLIRSGEDWLFVERRVSLDGTVANSSVKR